MRIPLLARVCVLCGSNERIERAVRKGVIQHSQGRPPDSWLPSELECTIDEGRHKTNGQQQAEELICPQGIAFFMIIRPDQEKNKNPWRP